jgi:hypothetical protein
MKKAAFIPAAFCIAYAFSAPTYYTFTGTVSFLASDVGGYAAAHGIHAGSAVTYYVAVDTARSGYDKFRGVVEPKPDINNPGYTADYFFDSLLTPSLYSPAVTDTASGSNLGYHTVTTSGTTTRYSLAFQFTFGNPDHRTQLLINIPDSGKADFMPKVGAKVAAVESYVDSSIANSGASMFLTLTAISGTRPNALRPASPATAAWMNTEWRNGDLVILNHSGKPASAKIMDVSGKKILAQTLGEKSVLSLSTFPHGSLFLEVSAPGTGQASSQMLVH